MAKFLLFEFEQYYPAGGMGDMRQEAFDTLDEAKAAAGKDAAYILRLDETGLYTASDYGASVIVGDHSYGWHDCNEPLVLLNG